jgi:NADPH:quinone reductase-like Zn-dependent oxidoreductase
VKAWQKRRGQLLLADVPDPTPAADELVLRVHAISLNRGEVRGARTGWKHSRMGRRWHGDRAGERMAQARSWCARRRPARQRRLGRKVAIPTVRAALIPEGIDFDIAAHFRSRALPSCAHALAAPLKGKRVLITGGSGGVGQFAIQLAALDGAEVCAVSSRAAQHEALRTSARRKSRPQSMWLKGPST